MIRMTEQTRRVMACFFDEDREWYGAQICATADLHSSTVTPILQRLVEAGWLRLTKKDGTRKMHRVTDKGRTEALAGMLRRGWAVPARWRS